MQNIYEIVLQRNNTILYKKKVSQLKYFPYKILLQPIIRILYDFLFVAKFEIPYELFRREFVHISTILNNQPRISVMLSYDKNRRKILNLSLRNKKNVGLDIYLRGIIYVLPYVFFRSKYYFSTKNTHLPTISQRREQANFLQCLCYLLRQGEQPREAILLLTNLLEDQTGGTNGYIDWMMQINRQSQQNP